MHHTDTPKGLPHRADELQNAPLLKALRGKKTSQAPEGYFTNLSERIADRMQDADVLAEAPELTAFGRTLKPAAPEGYFETLPGRITKQVSQNKVIAMWRRPAVWAVAAGIVILLSLFPLLQQNTPLGADEIAQTIDDLELYALADYIETDAEDIAAVFEISDVTMNDLEEISSDEADALLESLDLSDMDIVELLNETE